MLLEEHGARAHSECNAEASDSLIDCEKAVGINTVARQSTWDSEVDYRRVAEMQ